MYTAIQIANFFIKKHCQDKKSIGHVKLQKMVYIAYGWCWALLGRELFEDEIQAWEFGPVIPNVYYAFKNQGLEITNLVGEPENLNEGVNEVLEAVYKAYVDKESDRIIAITHAPGTPWSLVYDGTKNKGIPKGTIWRYFELLYAQRKKTIRT